jgi:hypothetical protein
MASMPADDRTAGRCSKERARLVGYALIGAGLPLSMAGSVDVPVGPLDTTVSARPARSGDATVRLARSLPGDEASDE